MKLLVYRSSTDPFVCTSFPLEGHSGSKRSQRRSRQELHSRLRQGTLRLPASNMLLRKRSRSARLYLHCGASIWWYQHLNATRPDFRRKRRLCCRATRYFSSYHRLRCYFCNFPSSSLPQPRSIIWRQHLRNRKLIVNICVSCATVSVTHLGGLFEPVRLRSLSLKLVHLRQQWSEMLIRGRSGLLAATCLFGVLTVVLAAGTPGAI